MPRRTDNTWLERMAGYLKNSSSFLTPAHEVGGGRKVVAAAGTAEPLASAGTYVKTVTITAETDNTGVMAVGGPTVVAALGTRRGTPLNAGDSLSMDIDDLSDIWIDTTVNGDGVTYTYTA